MLVQEATAVLLIKDRREAPWLLLERLHVLDLDDEHVARLGALNLKGPAEEVYAREINVLDVIGAVVVLDLATGPVDALDLDGLAGDDLADGGDCNGVLVCGFV